MFQLCLPFSPLTPSTSAHASLPTPLRVSFLPARSICSLCCSNVLARVCGLTLQLGQPVRGYAIRENQPLFLPQLRIASSYWTRGGMSCPQPRVGIWFSLGFHRFLCVVTSTEFTSRFLCCVSSQPSTTSSLTVSPPSFTVTPELLGSMFYLGWTF